MAATEFQSLGWVERLSDSMRQTCRRPLTRFQSLGWVERLSDSTKRRQRRKGRCFNPSDGLSVFQTVRVLGQQIGIDVSIPRMG